MQGEPRIRRMRLVTDKEAEQWDALARQHGYVDKEGNIIPSRIALEKVERVWHLCVRTITPVTAATHTEDLGPKAPPILFDRTPEGRMFLPGRWCQYIFEHLSEETVLPAELRGRTKFLARHARFRDVSLAPGIETVAFDVVDERGTWVRYEALPPLTPIVFEFELPPDDHEG